MSPSTVYDAVDAAAARQTGAMAGTVTTAVGGPDANLRPEGTWVQGIW